MSALTSDDKNGLSIAMLSIHSSPIGPLGTRDTGGMSVYIRELSRHLGQTGHRVDIYTCQSGDDQMLYPQVRLIHLALENMAHPLTKEDMPSHLPQVFDALERHRSQAGRDYDLIHSHYWLSGIVGAMAQTRWHRPHITMFHTLSKVKNNTASGENEPDKRIAHEQWLAKTADHIVVPTGREKQNLIRYYGARSAHIGTIPCGVNLDLFKPQDSHRVRESLGVPADAPMLLYVGRFAPLKGLDQLVLAAAQLQQCHENLHMVLVGGDGPLAPATIELQRLAESRGITRRIHFPGRVDQDQLPLFYNAADLVVLPSHYESFGLVVLEALACGTPVAATDVGGVDAVVREGVNGTVVAAPDADSIGSAVDRMLQRIKAHRPDKHAVRESIAAFDWRHIARLTVETYTRIMASHKMPGVSRSHACQTGIVP